MRRGFTGGGKLVGLSEVCLSEKTVFSTHFLHDIKTVV